MDLNSLPSITRAEAEALQNYVYVYYDSVSGVPFYVGRGKGNRVQSHLTGSHNDLVRARVAEGSFGVDMLAYGLDEETASKVEAAAIDLIGIDKLLNKTRGAGASKYGRIKFSTLLHSLQPQDLTEIRHNLIAVSIGTTYARYGDDPEALYESTRGVWTGITPEKANEADYIVGVVDGRIVYIMTAAAWLPAGSTNYFVRDRSEVDGRIEFVGRSASAEVEALYLGRRLTSGQSPRFYGPFHGKVLLVDGAWRPD